MEGKPWGIFELEDGVHVAPIDDRKDHILNMDCPCHPTVEWDGIPLVIHHAFDFREIMEELNEHLR
ncbi:MAG TPA: hypothetical protein PKD55_02560 [Bellilinea sp.]|nr:hypothetical protein [Bellilinea sp.]